MGQDSLNRLDSQAACSVEIKVFWCILIFRPVIEIRPFPMIGIKVKECTGRKSVVRESVGLLEYSVWGLLNDIGVE
jgi:hypothetical protein